MEVVMGMFDNTYGAKNYTPATLAAEVGTGLADMAGGAFGMRHEEDLVLDVMKNVNPDDLTSVISGYKEILAINPDAAVEYKAQMMPFVEARQQQIQVDTAKAKAMGEGKAANVGQQKLNLEMNARDVLSRAKKGTPEARKLLLENMSDYAGTEAYKALERKINKDRENAKAEASYTQDEIALKDNSKVNSIVSQFDVTTPAGLKSAVQELASNGLLLNTDAGKELLEHYNAMAPGLSELSQDERAQQMLSGTPPQQPVQPVQPMAQPQQPMVQPMPQTWDSVATAYNGYTPQPMQPQPPVAQTTQQEVIQQPPPTLKSMVSSISSSIKAGKQNLKQKNAQLSSLMGSGLGQTPTAQSLREDIKNTQAQLNSEVDDVNALKKTQLEQEKDKRAQDKVKQESKALDIQSQTNLETGLQGLDTGIETINDILKLFDDNPIEPLMGIGGALASNIPGSAAKDLESKLRTLSAINAFDSLKQLRESGGTLGQVTEKEIDLLIAEQGALDTEQSKEQLLNTLYRIKGRYVGARRNLKRKYKKINPDSKIFKDKNNLNDFFGIR